MKTVRVQLDVPQSRINDIKSMMDDTGLATRKDLYEDALTLFQWAINQRKAGRIFVSTNKDGSKPCELLMPSLAKVKPRE